VILIAITDLLQQYFKNKTLQLRASAEQAICEHPVLKGSHREDLIQIYLNDILPKRFELGKGMVYGQFHKSKEADIVIWDAQNYPKLQMQGHSLFFAESVRMVLEVKTNFNNETFIDILNKCETVRNIVPMRGLNIEDELIMMQQQIASLRTGEPFEGILKASHHIATGAVIFKGGLIFKANSVSQEIIDNADDTWPDIMILLEPGRVILKQYDDEGNGFLEFYEAGEDALLLFTSSLLGILTDRIVNVEEPFYLTGYIFKLLENFPSETIYFHPTRPIPGRRVI